MRAKAPGVLVLVGLALVVVASASSDTSASGAAKTRACLAKQRGYRGLWPPSKPANLKTPLEYTLIPPIRFLHAAPDLLPGTTAGGWRMAVVVDGSDVLAGKPSGTAFGQPTELFFFNKLSDARHQYQRALELARSADPHNAKQLVELDRNVFILWSRGDLPPSKRVTTLIRNCLRPR